MATVQILNERRNEYGRLIDVLVTTEDDKQYLFKEMLSGEGDALAHYTVPKRVHAFLRRIQEGQAVLITTDEMKAREDVALLDALLDALDADIDSKVAALQAGKDAVRNAVWTPLTNAQKIELLRDSVLLLLDAALFLTRALRTMRRVGRVCQRLAKNWIRNS